MPEYYIYDQSGRLRAEATLVSTTVDGKRQVVMYPEYQYVWGGDRVLVQFDILNNELYYYLYNGHGDVIQIVDIDGNIVNSYDYDVWGNFLKKEETIHNPFTYFGQTYDETTGLYDLRARYYDPTTGRFIQQDPAEDGYNWYVYGNNNPVMFVDITGLYNRKAAINYAKTYYSKRAYATEDVYLKNGDCAHFVSNCLLAGFLHQSDDWYMNIAIGVYNRMTGSYSRTWTVALDQYQIFSDPAKGYTSGTMQIWSKEGLQNAIMYQGVQEGDLIYFCGVDGNHPHQAAIITSIRDGDIYYNAHSGSRDDEPLSEHILSYVNGEYVKGTEVVVIVKIRDDA